MDNWLKENLVCPQDRSAMDLDGAALRCPNGHEYVVADGIPVLLFDDGQPTHGYITRSLEAAARIQAGEPVDAVLEFSGSDEAVDPYVQAEIPYTCGHLYIAVQHKMERYPFPELRLPDGEGRRLLDIGCNWGRWTVVAEQNGYRAVGIDPSLEAVMAARRVARQMGVSPQFVVADARYLPFADAAFDTTFSYSVIQHFKKSNALLAFEEMARTTKPGGRVVVQMPNKYGIRCIYHRARLGFKDGREGADCFYWSPAELKETFGRCFGSTEISVDCYFGLNVQKSDIDMLPSPHRVVIRASELFRSASASLPSLVNFADSVYVESINEKAGTQHD